MGCAAGVESKADEPEKEHRNGEPKGGKVSRKKKKKAKGGGCSDNNGAFDGVMTATKRPADEEGGRKARRQKVAGSGSDDKKKSKGKEGRGKEKAKAKKGKEVPSPSKTGHINAVNWTTESVHRHFDFSAASILSSEKMRKVDRWMFSRPIQSFPLSSPQETADEQGAAAPSNEDKDEAPSKGTDPDIRPRYSQPRAEAPPHTRRPYSPVHNRSDSLLLRKLSVQELTALMPDIGGQKPVTSSVVWPSSPHRRCTLRTQHAQETTQYKTKQNKTNKQTHTHVGKTHYTTPTSQVTRSSVQVDLNEERESLGPSTPSKTTPTPPTANHTAEPPGRKKT